MRDDEQPDDTTERIRRAHLDEWAEAWTRDGDPDDWIDDAWRRLNRRSA